MPWTKVPNYLIDQSMPTLRDTELRVLLVLLRQTVGWQREGKAVILSYRFLKAQTGRQSAAIAAALKSLRKRGLIHSLRPDTPRLIRFAMSADSQSKQQQYTEI